MPNPTPLRPVANAGDPQRNVDCPSYNACLNRATRSRWADWTCSRCENASQAGARPDIDAFAHDRRGR